MESGALENGFIGCSGAWKKIGYNTMSNKKGIGKNSKSTKWVLHIFEKCLCDNIHFRITRQN